MKPRPPRLAMSPTGDVIWNPENGTCVRDHLGVLRLTDAGRAALAAEFGHAAAKVKTPAPDKRARKQKEARHV